VRDPAGAAAGEREGEPRPRRQLGSLRGRQRRRGGAREGQQQ
jgi:hypothetical protein